MIRASASSNVGLGGSFFEALPEQTRVSFVVSVVGAGGTIACARAQTGRRDNLGARAPLEQGSNISPEAIQDRVIRSSFPGEKNDDHALEEVGDQGPIASVQPQAKRSTRDDSVEVRSRRILATILALRDGNFFCAIAIGLGTE